MALVALEARSSSRREGEGRGARREEEEEGALVEVYSRVAEC
jgi:hypothetical protein